MDSKVKVKVIVLSEFHDDFSGSNRSHSFDDSFDDDDWMEINIEQPFVEEHKVQLVAPIDTMNHQGQGERVHLILASNGPEYEQARSALEYNQNELAWDLYHYHKVNLELMQRKEQSIRTASTVLATAIRKSIDERLTKCHDLYCLVHWIEGNHDEEVDLLALDSIYGHRTQACENLIQRLGRVLTEQEYKEVSNNQPIELDFSILNDLMEESGVSIITSNSSEQRTESDVQPEPMPEWLDDLMISYSDEALDLANSIKKAETDWTQASMYKTLKAASTQGPFYPYHPKECHVYAVLFEVRRGIHHEQ